MIATNHERPGVYSVFEASSVVRGDGGSRTVGVVLNYEGDAEQKKKLLRFTRYEDAAGLLAKGSRALEMIRVLFLNGASTVAAVLVSVDSDYRGAFELLSGEDDVAVLTCDSRGVLIHTQMKERLMEDAEARRERIGVVSCLQGESLSDMQLRVKGINCERIVAVAPATGVIADGTPEAMAVAAILAREKDPAAPLNGLALKGMGEVNRRFTDTEIDTLVRGGVTLLEPVNGALTILRAVTTRVNTNGAPDSTWRELTTIRIIDDVIPTIRNSLQSRFQRAKNTEQTRGAIRSQVILELENKVAKEIIAGYGNVTVTPLEDRPTVCLVEFQFTVAHGLNQIWLSAQITV